MQIGGETWYQPGMQTYYRDPGPPAPRWQAPKATVAPHAYDKLHEAADILRAAARHLDRGWKRGDMSVVEPAQHGIQQAQEILR